MSRTHKHPKKSPWTVERKERPRKGSPKTPFNKTYNRRQAYLAGLDYNGEDFRFMGRQSKRDFVDRKHEQEIREALDEIQGSRYTEGANVYGEV